MRTAAGWEALTEADPLSIMHRGGCATVDEPSELDRLGVRRLYGMPAAWYVAADLI